MEFTDIYMEWTGKRNSYLESLAEPTKILQPLVEKSVNWDTTENIYIEGDNFESLKLLQKTYAGRIKMIYIDPPYNTRSNLTYPDSFSHSYWCSMIYSRLLVAKNLLSDDGAIFISIDDNEVEHLKMICNEVFDRSNFVGQWNWYKSATPPNISKKIKKNIEYILCYEKKRNSVKYRGLKKVSPSNNGLLNQTNRFATLTFPENVVETGLPDGLYKAGKYGTNRYEVNLLDDVNVSNGLFINKFRLQAKFKWGQEKLLREIANGTTISIRTKTFSPSYEKITYDPEVPPNLIDKSVNVDTTEQAGKALTALFDNVKVFDYPKPVSLITYLMNFICDEDDIVMDFFSGSATTAHAVLAHNVAQQGNRKFILVQAPEEIKEDTEAYKAGYSTICDIGEERIKRVINKLKAENPDTSADLGFKVFKLEDSDT